MRDRAIVASYYALVTVRRVVVTGLGAVTPLGLDAQSTWDAAVAGRSGVDWIRAFDASDYPVRIASEVKGFEAEAIVGAKDARRLQRTKLFSLLRRLVRRGGMPASRESILPAPEFSSALPSVASWA